MKRTAVLTSTVFLLIAGCAQSTDTPTMQGAGQPIDQPNMQEQAADVEGASQGAGINKVYVTVTNAPGQSASPLPVPEEIASVTSVERTTSDAGGNNVSDTRAGYVQSGFTVVINTGGTSTPTQSAAASGATQTPSASATASPNSTATVTPTQEVKPSTAITPNVALAPGAQASGNSQAAAEGSSPAQTNTISQEARTAFEQFAKTGDPKFWEQAWRLLGLEGPVPPVPATQPTP